MGGLLANPYSDAFHQDPFPVYARLRDEAPVYQVPELPDLYFVTTWELVREALMDTERFSNYPPPAKRSTPPPEVADEVAEIRKGSFEYHPSLGSADPPLHTRNRRIVNRAFTVRSLAWMEPLVRDVAVELVDALPDGQVVEMMDSLTIPLPVWAIMRILGLDESWRSDLRRWSASATGSLGGLMTPERWVEAERDMVDFKVAICEQFELRRRSPRDDLLSVLVQPVDGEALSDRELFWMTRELMVAGNETTTRGLADILVILSRQPEAWDRLRDDDAFRRKVVEEGLRVVSPVMGLWRRAMCDIEYGGVLIPEGSSVFLSYGSANHDESVFADADEFDPVRANVREHLAFGHGIHACVGAGLARMEIDTVLKTLADRIDSLEVVDPESLRYSSSYALRGLVELPMMVHTREDVRS